MFVNFTEELDHKCLEIFPEILDEFAHQDLVEASSIGRYIFFEDYFNDFIEMHQNSERTLLRAAKFIEGMARSHNQDIKNLVEIGILSGLVSRQVFGIAKYLGSHSKKLLSEASSHTKVDQEVWCLNKETVVKLSK